MGVFRIVAPCWFLPMTHRAPLMTDLRGGLAPAWKATEREVEIEAVARNSCLEGLQLRICF